MLTRIFHTDLLRKPGRPMEAVLGDDFGWSSRDSYSSARKSSPVLPHQPSRLPRHDQYEISGLKLFVTCCALFAIGSLVIPSALANTGAESKPSIDLPVLVGQDIKGITVPQYDQEGHLSMKFSAETARKIDEHQVSLGALTIEFFEKDGKDITVVVPSGIFNLETKILSSDGDGNVTIKREDFDVVGQSATFDTVKRFGTMKGHVHTEIRNSAPNDEL